MGIWAMGEPASACGEAPGEADTRQRGSGLRKRAAASAATIAGIAAIGLLLAACGSSNSSSPSNTGAAGATTPAATATTPAASASQAAASGTATLKTESTSLGMVLTTAQGMTVYWFAADHGTMSACSGNCAAAWPPVIGMPKAAAGVTLTGTFGTITRSDGSKQATYNGHPLYTFKADTSPGQVNGNAVSGFGAKWYAITIGAGGAGSTTPSGSATKSSSWS
jgi:predicted lipoprotein with Yx(FWY)xxD motif